MEARQVLIAAAESLVLAETLGLGVTEARERLSAALRALLVKCLRPRAGEVLAEDLAQETTRKVLDALEKKFTTIERLEVYTEAAGRNAWRDHLRRSSTRRETPTDPHDMPAGHDRSETPEEALEHAQTRHITAERMRTLVAQAPEKYRRALSEHYLEERPVQSLVDDEITVRIELSGGDPQDPIERSRLQFKARETVDQRLSRGRHWLRNRLDARED